nr:hypothetical protein [Streptococcus loxodontisalivarius]
MFGSKKEENTKYKLEQDRIANYLIEHIELVDGESIKEIEFVEFQKNNMTGTWRITATINEKYDISFSEDSLGGEIETANYSPKEFEESYEKLSNDYSIKDIEIEYFKE